MAKNKGNLEPLSFLKQPSNMRTDISCILAMASKAPETPETPAQKLRRLAERGGATAWMNFLIQANLDQLKKEDIPENIRSELIGKCTERMRSLSITSSEIKSKGLPARERFEAGRLERYFTILNFLIGENAIKAAKYASESPQVSR